MIKIYYQLTCLNPSVLNLFEIKSIAILTVSKLNNTIFFLHYFAIMVMLNLTSILIYIYVLEEKIDNNNLKNI